MIQVKVDMDVCVGHGKCYMIDAELFEPIESDENGRARPKINFIDSRDKELMGRIERVRCGCPEGAIVVSSDV